MSGINQSNGRAIVPGPMRGNKMVSDENCVFLVSGNVYRPKLWRYNIHSGQWKLIDGRQARLPERGRYSIAILSGHMLVVCEDKDGVNNLTLSPIRKHALQISWADQVNLNFNVTCITDMPTNLTLNNSTVFGDNLYAVNNLDAVKINIKDGVWNAYFRQPVLSSAQPLSADTLGGTIATDGVRLFKLGGVIPRNDSDVEKMPLRFDKPLALTTVGNKKIRNWKEMFTNPEETEETELYPSIRRFHSSVQLGKHVYVFGGEKLETDGEGLIIEDRNNKKLLKDIWRLNLETLSWKRYKNFSLPRSVYGHSSCVTPTGKMFVFGGAVESKRTRDGHMLTRETNNFYTAWLKVPSLKEIVWEAVCYYNPKLVYLSGEQLLSSGIPAEFVRKLKM